MPTYVHSKLYKYPSNDLDFRADQSPSIALGFNINYFLKLGKKLNEKSSTVVITKITKVFIKNLN